MKFQTTIFSVALVLAISGWADAQKPLAIKAGKIITMNGEPIENGTIIIRDGRIHAIGKDLQIPVEARMLDASDQVVMPGFIEAHSSSGMSQSNETNPLVPYVSVLDSIDPMNAYFQESRRNGVTSVAITPGNSTMIGGQAAVIKTGGEFVDEMVLKPDAGVKISLRPMSGSRMSHLAKLRKALDDARKKMADKDGDKEKVAAAGEASDEKQGGPRNPDGGDDAKQDDDSKPAAEAKTAQPMEKPETELDKAMFALLSGKLPAIIYCEKAMDVGQAMRLIKEYDLTAKLVLGRECYKAAAQIAKSGLPIVLDANLVFWEEDPRTREDKKIVLTKLFRDHDAKFTFQIARSGRNTLGNNYLWYQAATAVKYGMPQQEALEALTILPAKFHNIDKYVGTLEEGKDADLVVLSGEPLNINTWVEKTIVNGEVVYDKKKDDQLSRLLSGEDNRN